VAATAPAGSSHEPVAGTVQHPYSSFPNWLYPAWVVFWLGLFVVYAGLVVLFESSGRYGPYLSPFFSPEINLRAGGFLIPPAIWVAWAPLLFRLTCYYYRKAYFRSFLWHPRSCAVEEPRRGTYRGETGFWIFNNLHRYAFYVIAVQTLFLVYDAIAALFQHGQLGAPLGLGNLLMLVNVVALGGYTYGCHAFRHLAGGDVDCFSCHRARFTLWKGVTVLNVRHDRWAWVSMFTVWGTDVYIRLLIHDVLPRAPWN
jgi:hypothetical protein